MGGRVSASPLPPSGRWQGDDPVQVAVAFLEARLGAAGQDASSNLAASGLSNLVDAGWA
jgi:hypothetical protein